MGKENVFIPKEELEKLYLIEKMPMTKIAKKFGCRHSSIAIKMKKYNIKARTTSESTKLFGPKNKIEIPKEELIRLYNKSVPFEKIAKKFNCKICTVTNRLREYGVSIKKAKGVRVIIDKKQLKDLYEKQKLTTYQIADKYNCCHATIRKKLKKFEIKRRNSHELYSNVPSKEELIELYVNKKLSTWEIEKNMDILKLLCIED